MFELLEERGAERCLLWSDAASGLRAVLVIDSLSLGPAAGGIRTRAYPSLEAAVDDAARLARAMTVKCALAGLDAGGGKAVVMEHPGFDRAAGFAVLGQRVQELRGMFRTAGDLGTTAADLAIMAEHTDYVHTDETGLADAVARGLVRCVQACAEQRDRSLAGLRIAVQGTGAIGAAAARALHAAGAVLVVADLDRTRADALAAELDATVCEAGRILAAEVDVVCPCAVGGVIDTAAVDELQAWAVCGAANNLLADESIGELLASRRVLFVPDVIASAGAVIQGIGRTVMNLADCEPLIDRLGDTARQILQMAEIRGEPANEIARELASKRLGQR